MTDPGIQLGAHTFIWAPQWDVEGARLAASRASAAGLSIVEIPLLEPSRIDVDSTVRILADSGVRPTCSLGLPTEAHAPDHPDAAIEFLRVAIDTCAAIGSEWLTGALYGHLGLVTGEAPTKAEHHTIAEVLRHAADHAKQRGIRLGVEVINRYETHLVNTAEQALDLLADIDRPGTVFAHLDTFHMNIEEASPAETLREVGSLPGNLIGHIHWADSNRRAMGLGHTDARAAFDALESTGYSGYLAAGRVTIGKEKDWLKQSIEDAIRIARLTDENIQADNEVI